MNIASTLLTDRVVRAVLLLLLEDKQLELILERRHTRIWTYDFTENKVDVILRYIFTSRALKVRQYNLP